MASGQAHSQSLAGTFAPLPKADIRSVEEALLTVPSGYIDAASTISTLSDTLKALASGRPRIVGEFNIIEIIGFDDQKKPVPPSHTFAWNRTAKRYYSQRLEIICADHAKQQFYITVFGAIGSWKDVTAGLHLFSVSAAKQYSDRTHLVAELCEGRDRQVLGKVAPIYSGIAGSVSADRLTQCVDAAVLKAAQEPEIWSRSRDLILHEARCTETALLKSAEVDGTDLVEILRSLHSPRSYEEGLRVRQAVVRMAAAAVRSRSQHTYGHRPANPSCAITGIDVLAKRLVDTLASDRGIFLTNNQVDCIAKLTNAMARSQPSAHLLNGDVGSGKTLTFLVPAIAAFLLGRKVAVMAPTDLLADQMVAEMGRVFPDVAVSRIEAGRKLPTGHTFLIGTPGLAAVCAKAGLALDVAVIDEQHKIPAATREALVSARTHVIEATATPIPRSMAIAMHAGLVQLTLSEIPFKNSRDTRAVWGPNDRKKTSMMVSKILMEGAKVAFVYPAVAGTEIAADMAPAERLAAESRARASVKDAYERLNAKWPGKVAKLYSEMSAGEQRAEIDALHSGEKNALVASSLIEVGVNIPRLDGMVVYNADRFGLAQLHQLRGRLARNGGTGCFMMFMEHPMEHYDKSTVERIKAMETVNDGFHLAEIDLLQRGFGDTGGGRQSGRCYTVFRGLELSPWDFLQQAGQEQPASPMNENCATAPAEECDDYTPEGQMTLL